MMTKRDNEPGFPGGGTTRPAEGKSALDWPGQAGTSELVLREVEVQIRRRRRRRRLAAGSLGGLAMLGLIWLAQPFVAAPRLPASALVSQPARQTLPDGSLVELNDGAKIDVDFAGAFRRVVLTRGEAHFQVAKNPARPFVVRAGEVEVYAVGTAFSVQLGRAAVEVLVTEGRVAVDRPAPPTMAATNRPDRNSQTFVDAGNLAVVTMDGAVQTVPVPRVLPLSAGELDDRLSWRKPRLEFSGTPLAEVLRLFLRYSGVHITLADPVLGELEVSGVVRADNIEALLLLLKTNFGIVADRQGMDQIVLSKPGGR